ncbi:MAG: hypothetical protein U0R28_13395 [Candidatus Nanopelagicales bacterium]
MVPTRAAALPVKGQQLRLLVAGAAQDAERVRLLREVVQGEMVHQLADRFGGRDASARAAAFGAQLAGLILARYWLAIEPLASMTVEEVVRFTAPGLHAAMHGPTRRTRRGR